MRNNHLQEEDLRQEDLREEGFRKEDPRGEASQEEGLPEEDGLPEDADFINFHSLKYGIIIGAGLMLLIGSIVSFIGGRITDAKRDKLLAPMEAEETQARSDELHLDEEKISRKLENIESIVNQYYLDEIDQDEVESWLYKGLIAGLGDNYADYYTKEELKKTTEASNGSYEGIGAVMSQDRTTGAILLTRCYEGAPAAETGLLPGDMVYTVNGLEVQGMDLSEVVSRIKTEPGETVNIEVIRGESEEPLSFDVKRAPVEIPTVSHEMLEGKIGYIEITEFDVITEEQFREAMADLESQGMEKLVVDLRNNPGGVLGSVCNVLEQILPEGLIVYTEDRNGERDEYRCSGDHEFKKPLAVLVNGNSASAAEIFAGAVKDYGIGTLVGTTTFGKGIVQRIINLNDGTAVKLTVSKYYTPKGNNIHKVGIEPDVEVELDEELRQKVTIEKSEDNQLQKAVEILNQK